MLLAHETTLAPFEANSTAWIWKNLKTTNQIMNTSDGDIEACRNLKRRQIAKQTRLTSKDNKYLRKVLLHA